MDARRKDRQLRSDVEVLLREKRKERDEEDLERKIERIREATDLLKYKLRKEKEKLERERWRTSSVQTVRAPSHVVVPLSPGCISTSLMVVQSPPEFAGYQHLRPVSNLQRQHLIVVPNATAYSIPYLPETPGCIPSVQTSLYRSRLDDVDRQCREELRRMQSNIKNLGRMREYWRNREPEDEGEEKEAPSATSFGDNYAKRTIRRRIRRRVYYGDNIGN